MKSEKFLGFFIKTASYWLFADLKTLAVLSRPFCFAAIFYFINQVE